MMNYVLRGLFMQTTFESLKLGLSRKGHIMLTTGDLHFGSRILLIVGCCPVSDRSSSRKQKFFGMPRNSRIFTPVLERKLLHSLDIYVARLRNRVRSILVKTTALKRELHGNFVCMQIVILCTRCEYAFHLKFHWLHAHRFTLHSPWACFHLIIPLAAPARTMFYIVLYVCMFFIPLAARTSLYIAITVGMF